MDTKEYSLNESEVETIKELREKVTLVGYSNPLISLSEKGIVSIVPLTSATFELTTLGYMLAEKIKEDIK